MKPLTLIPFLLAALAMQAQTFRIESSFSDQVHALIIDSKAPVRLVCNAPQGQQSLTLTTPEAEYQFNPVAAVRDSLLTISYPHSEGSIHLSLSRMPSYITLRTGSTLVIDSLDNYTAYSHKTRCWFVVEEHAELRMQQHFSPSELALDLMPHGRILFPEGVDLSAVASLNLMDSSLFEANPEQSNLSSLLSLYEGKERQGTEIKVKGNNHLTQPTDHSVIGTKCYNRYHHIDGPAHNISMLLTLTAGLRSGFNSRTAILSPYALGTGLMAEVNLLFLANWDRRYNNGFDANGQSLYKRHRTWVGLTYGFEFLPFTNQVVRTDGGDISFTDNPSAVLSTPNGGPGTRAVLFNTYLSLPLEYSFTTDRKSGFAIGLHPGINLTPAIGAMKSNGFNVAGAAGPEEGALNVMNRWRLEAAFSFAIRGVRMLPSLRVGLLPTFTTPEGEGVHMLTFNLGF